MSNRKLYIEQGLVNVRKKLEKILDSTSSLNELTASDLSALITLLIERELHPGGPYNFTSDQKLNVRFNAKIFILFAQAGKFLNATQEYVGSMKHLLTKVELTSFEEMSSLPLNKGPGKEENPLHHKLNLGIRKLFPVDLQYLGLEIYTKIRNVDHRGEITNISAEFVKSISLTRPHEKINDSISLLGVANFYTWMAYSLYDHIIDENEGAIALPTANIFNREAYYSYVQAGASPEIIRALFNKVDLANAQELTECRLEIKGNEIILDKLPEIVPLKKLMGRKSIAHCIGPLTVWALRTDTTLPIEEVELIFTQYCEARQFNDDIHDWEDDLRHGRITYTNAWLLRAALIKPGKYNVESLISELRKTYWHSGLDELLSQIEKIAHQTEINFINQLCVDRHSAFLDITIRPIIDSVIKVREEYLKTKEFLHSIEFK